MQIKHLERLLAAVDRLERAARHAAELLLGCPDEDVALSASVELENATNAVREIRAEAAE